MGICKICGTKSNIISDRIGVCVKCLREKHEEALALVSERRAYYRGLYDLPPETPRAEKGFQCTICGRGCILGKGMKGYCGVRVYDKGLEIITGSNDKAIGMYYYDPHPTNCVAYNVCPAVTGRGYPRYALSPAGERGYYNIAVFYGACNLDCLYCQNWEFRRMVKERKPIITIQDLVESVNHRTTCVCFFGGDPAPWSTHALLAARKMVEKAKSIGLDVFRVCWETNGLWNPILFEKAIKLSLETGGIVKIDFKAWSPEVYFALTGAEPQHVDIIRKNIALVAKYFEERKDPPVLVVSTLLVPGYIDEYELDEMTRFVASLNPEIPYVFLAFHPDYVLRDLPRTSIKHAEKAVEIAKKNGLRNIFVENVWLLGNEY